MRMNLKLGLLLVGLLLAGPSWGEELATVAVPHPHGTAVCSSGCARSNHPTPTLEVDRFYSLIQAYQNHPANQASPPLEELLYYGPQTRELLDQLVNPPLDSTHLAFLRRELRRDHCRIEFRVIDEKNQVRVWLDPIVVPLDLRHVFHPLKFHGFQPAEASGTVKRVGLDHVWQRI